MHHSENLYLTYMQYYSIIIDVDRFGCVNDISLDKTLAWKMAFIEIRQLVRPLIIQPIPVYITYIITKGGMILNVTDATAVIESVKESWTKHDRNGVPRYNPISAISKNRFIAYIVGARGYGKTYGFKKELIKRAINDPDNKRFIYLRRYVTEVDAITDFFGNLRADPDFADYEFDVRARRIRYAKREDFLEESTKVNWQTIGMIYALTEAKKIKSQDYPEYLYLVYDEWLAEKGSDFLANEPRQFMNLLHSIFREKDFQAFCLANSTLLHNPYFSYFNFYPNLSKQFTYDRVRNQLIQMIPGGEFIEFANKTAIGRLSQGTEYHDYAFGNEFNDNDDSLVEPRDSNVSNDAILMLDNHTKLGIWSNRDGMYWFSEKYNEECVNKFALDVKYVNEQYRGISAFYRTLLFHQLKTAANWNDIRFDTKKAKGKSSQIVKALRLFI